MNTERPSRRRQTFVLMCFALLAVTFGDLVMSSAMRSLGPLKIESLESWWRGQGGLSEVPVECYELLWTIFTLKSVWVAILFMLSFLVMWTIALSWEELSFVMPLTALTYVLNAVLVGPVLGENVSLTRWFGTILITFGVFLIGTEPGHESKRPEETQIS